MSETGERKKNMTCAEFQEGLPYIFESGGDGSEMEHLKTCQICSDLVQDLQYIADQAKLLLPLRDPSPQVWDKIQNSLAREGLVRSKAKAHGVGKKKLIENGLFHAENETTEHRKKSSDRPSGHRTK